MACNPKVSFLTRAGNFYGTTYLGGKAGCGAYSTCGTVFEMTHNQDGSWGKSVIYRFTGDLDGGIPGSRLTLDSEGNIYGTTQAGGNTRCTNSCGTVFKLAPNGHKQWALNTLYSFQGGSDGAQPNFGVIFDSSGNLYGTADNGGVCNPGCNGVVFKLTPNQSGSWTPTVLYSFLGGADGYNPEAVVFDATGNLYGTTPYGGDTQGICGAQGCGKVFQLKPNLDGTWIENDLYVFTNGKDGGYPTSAVTFDAAGNLYGETIYGGDYYCESGGCGVVFQLAPDGNGVWNETVLHTFHGQDGTGPSGGLVFDSAGNLYGTASGGGTVPACPVFGCGLIFKLSPGGIGGSMTFSVISAFNRADGLEPDSGVIVDNAGNIYGTAVQGGNLDCPEYGCGVVFTLTP